MRGMRYKERLFHFELKSLDERRRRGDLIQFHKIFNKFDGINWLHPPKSKVIMAPAAEFRGHPFKVSKTRGLKFAARFNFLNNRIVNDWNHSLDEEIFQARSTNHFKNLIDRRVFKI